MTNKKDQPEQAEEKREGSGKGKYHYNPGNQSGKTVKSPAENPQGNQKR